MITSLSPFKRENETKVQGHFPVLRHHSKGLEQTLNWKTCKSCELLHTNFHLVLTFFGICCFIRDWHVSCKENFNCETSLVCFFFFKQKIFNLIFHRQNIDFEKWKIIITMKSNCESKPKENNSLNLEIKP